MWHKSTAIKQKWPVGTEEEICPLQKNTDNPKTKRFAKHTYQTFDSIKSNERHFTSSQKKNSNASSLLRLWSTEKSKSERCYLYTDGKTFSRRFSLAKVILIFIVGILLAFLFHNLRSKAAAATAQNPTPDWKWDHNAYHHRQNQSSFSSSSDQRSPSLLMLTHDPTDRLALYSEISSRPNRAYAYAWRRDYAHYTGAQWNKAQLLEHIYQKHRNLYDAVLLLPADAIITNLDYDLFGLLPLDAIASVYGNEENVIVLNFQHPDTAALLEAWASQSEIVRHGSPQDYLIALEKDKLGGSNLTSTDGFNLIQFLPASDGFVEIGSGDELQIPAIKLNLFQDPPSPSDDEVLRALQSTADSVCFRYFPKCDIL